MLLFFNLPSGVMIWSVVYESGISWSCPLTFSVIYNSFILNKPKLQKTNVINYVTYYVCFMCIRVNLVYNNL